MTEILRRVYSEQGQSPWLDNLQRAYLTSGVLAELVKSGVRGLTSNPTIFQKAIQGSSDYDEQFAEELAKGSTPVDAYWEMVIADINGAADVFQSLFDSSNGGDGFVSVEVDPRLAHDGSGTLSAARRLHEVVNRSNVMIKIPATQEGIPAIREMIAEGRNVNVTLIFSLSRYQDVMDAYIDGLEQRVESGLSPAGISSVASFFISRVDNEIDKRLNALGTTDALSLRGTAAVNQARLAYALFQKTFSGPRWERLKNAGAQVQRPLWASTSTKNPDYPDTKYVDELIGPHTVNTLPEPTLHAFADHGTIDCTIDRDLSTSRRQWAQLAMNQIDVDDVAQQLEREGVASFIQSFEELIHALEAKAETL